MEFKDQEKLNPLHKGKASLPQIGKTQNEES